MDLVSRLILFKESTGLTNSQFADTAEIPRPTLSQFINGRNKRLSDELIAKLHSAYPQLNISWLLFGEGEMTNSTTVVSQQSDISSSSAELSKEMAMGQPDADDILSSNETIKDSHATESINDSVNIDKAANEIAAKVMTSMFGGGVPHPSKEKKIKSIMVFYSDNSYETFIPQN